ncbi:hypothetical protein PYCCODRAFT_1432107 [Trametes coccinea BRFM310]|uniref:Uncharacterized protein n=1 Tax=Trametes coccinea (strain BRFM310) TaxID=1353009 RepID=A0A1Y2IY43_TRAC3|nr:hypothetical protein PYCCODRAFT_1432107 [Trametes coccinea BRFM310]
MSDETRNTTSQNVEDRSSAELSDPLDVVMTAMTSEEAGNSAVGGHGVSLTGESAHPSGPVVLNPGKLKRFDWLPLIITSWHVPILGLAYFAHVRYRRLSPRRLPPFTPMKLPGVYGSLAIWQFVFNASYLNEVEIDTKQELLAVRMIRVVNETLAVKLRGSHKSAIDNLDPETKSTLRSLLEKEYRGYSLTEKLNWWHHNWRSDENTRLYTTCLWLVILEGHGKEIPWKDLKTCATHLANECSTTPEMDSLDYLWTPLYALLASVPLAMLARRTRIPAFFLPLNGIQRLLIGATIYSGPIQRYEHYSQLRNLQQSERIAKIVEEWLNARLIAEKARNEKQSGSATSSSA